jgi:hypothetical protein
MNGKLQRVVVALGLAAVVAGSAHAADILRADSLLAIDRNRGVVIEQIIRQFKGGFAAGQEKMVRETLQSLRADHLLAASLAPSLPGLLAAINSADTGVGAAPISPKALGDPTADLVYTPRTPCRLFDTRPTQNGLGALIPGVTRTYSATAPVAQQGGPGGCTAPSGTAVAMIQISTISPPAAGLLQGGATGTGPFANSLILFQPGDQYGASIPMPVVVANGRFDLVAQFSGVDVAGDLLGYFAEPQATALDCQYLAVHGTGALVANGGLVSVPFPACSAGYVRTGVGCHADDAINSYLVNSSPSVFGDCVFRNLTGGNVTPGSYAAEAVCCRVPGR